MTFWGLIVRLKRLAIWESLMQCPNVEDTANDGLRGAATPILTAKQICSPHSRDTGDRNGLGLGSCCLGLGLEGSVSAFFETDQ